VEEERWSEGWRARFFRGQCDTTIGGFLVFDSDRKYIKGHLLFTQIIDMYKIKKNDPTIAKKITYLCDDISITNVDLNFDLNFISVFALFRERYEVLLRIPIHQRDLFEFYINVYLNSIFDVSSNQKDLQIEMIQSKKNDIYFCFEN